MAAIMLSSQQIQQLEDIAMRVEGEHLGNMVRLLQAEGLKITIAQLNGGSDSARAKHLFDYARLRLPRGKLMKVQDVLDLMSRASDPAVPPTSGNGTALEQKSPLPTTIPNWPPKSILFLTAAPVNGSRLRTDKEREAIRQELRSLGTNSPKMEDRWATQRDDLGRHLLEEDAEMIHFGGHGVAGKLVFEDGVGQGATAPLAAIAQMLNTGGCKARWVILTACETFDNAQCLVETGQDWKRRVICCSGAVDDSKAIQFTTGFYRAISLCRPGRFDSFDKCYAYALAESGLIEADGDILML